MERFRFLLQFALATLGWCGIATSDSIAAPPRCVWQIGQRDNNNAEFALSPGGFSRFQTDAYFLIGRSTSKRDWPYVQPGPTDGWAGSRPHTFTVLFGLADLPPPGTCRAQAPPARHPEYRPTVAGNPCQRLRL